ncbi:MAG: glycosyltransferase family 2 protein [bacterium]|nr:glycosyltransferase family 2 protein [bacterium]
MSLLSEKPNIIGMIPAYNCAHLLLRAFEQVPKQYFDDIIIVDDGSTDDTLAVAKTLGAKVFTHPHSGYGGNIKYAIKKAIELGADYMIEIHGDGQYDPENIPTAIEKIKNEQPDFLLGSRFTSILGPLRDKMPLPRYLANLGMSLIDRAVLRLPLTEFHQGFRVYSRRLIERVGLQDTSDDHLFSFQIIAKAAFFKMKVMEIPVRCDYSGEHTSISLTRSFVYATHTFGVLGLYLFAKLGFKTRLFKDEGVH